MAFKKENLLYLALAIPVLMIVITMLSVFFFQVDLHPKYNFIYAQINTPSDFVCEMQLEAKLHPDSFPKNIKVPYNNPDHDCSKAELYLYDFSAKSSTKLTIEQAQKYLLSSKYPQQSPDGFTIQTYCGSGNTLGWWNAGIRGSGICLRKDNYQQQLDIDRKHKLGDIYQRFIFLGWILGEKQQPK